MVSFDTFKYKSGSSMIFTPTKLTLPFVAIALVEGTVSEHADN
jgi:hypothetical protein